MSDIESTLDAAADAAGYARNALRAQKATIEAQAARIAKLEAALGQCVRAGDEAVDAMCESGWGRRPLVVDLLAATDAARAALDGTGAAGENECTG